MPSTKDTRRPNSDESNRRYAKFARTFDRRNMLGFSRLRADAANMLELKPGDHVLEAGSGTGANFANLVEAVGPAGKVTGVELSPDMAAVARERIAAAGWDNVEIRMGAAAEAELPTGLDGALFFMTHDILRTPEALDNVVGALRPGAKVVSFGPKASVWWNPMNLVVNLKARGYHTTFEGFDRPWTLLAERLEDFSAKPKTFGVSYLGSGRVPA